MVQGDPPLLQRGDALFLDFDGTVVDIASRPDRVRVEPTLIAQLTAMRDALDGALAIVSGRRLADVDRYLHPLVLLGAGLHGAELRTPEGVTFADARAQELSEAVAKMRARFDGEAGILIEDKGLSVALHYRNAPLLEDECRQLARELAQRLSLHLTEGKRVVELRGAGADKGDAVRALMRHEHFYRRRPVFLGDDVTDEDAFAAVEAMHGVTVKVGEGATGARHRLPNVLAVHGWLARSREPLAAPVAA